MEKPISMTAKQIQKTYGDDRAKLKAQLESAPEFDEDPNPGSVPVARGFAAFKEYINRKGRPKAEDPKVSISIRIPMSKAEALRATGPGWQTRTSNFILKGIDRGELV